MRNKKILNYTKKKVIRKTKYLLAKIKAFSELEVDKDYPTIKLGASLAVFSTV